VFYGLERRVSVGSRAELVAVIGGLVGQSKPVKEFLEGIVLIRRKYRLHSWLERTNGRAAASRQLRPGHARLAL
jgi:hypothetical protein